MSRPCRNWLSPVCAISRCYRCRWLRQISVAGCPEPVEALRGAGTGRIDEERIANALPHQVIALGSAPGAIARGSD
jgi:hypothetical protein